MFTHLHLHSHYSLFDGFSKIPDIVAKAKSLGHNSVAITDHGTLSPIMEFYKECKKQGIKPILGLESYFVPDVNATEQKRHHLVLLAKNDIGYTNLKKMHRISNEQYFYYKPRIDLSLLSQYKEGLICLSACIASPINTDNGVYYAEQLKSIFGDDFYLEIQPNSTPEQKEYNEKLVLIANSLDIPLVVTCDSHYINQEDAKYHRKWVGINKKENEHYPVDDWYMMDEGDIFKRLSTQGLDSPVIENAIRNTQVIADKCNVEIEVTGNHYPKFPVDDPLEAVKDICRDNWKEKVATKVKTKSEYQRYLDRFFSELQVLEKCNYLNYLLITHDMLNWCKKNDIITGPGRGSAGGSLVCYLMGITHVDPIQHDLLFSRFVNPDRVTPCDIDNDVSKRRRHEVIEYIRQQYGEVYNIRTFNYLGVKGAIQRAGQALGIEPKEVNRISTSIPKSAETFNDVNLNIDESWLEIAKRFFGLISSFGCHASAVLVFPDDPTNYCAIEKQGDTMVAAYDYHDLEEMGLLKLDVLGLKTLDVIDDTAKMVNLQNPYDLDLNDKDTLNLFAQGETTGLFQVESTGMKNLCKQMKVDCFDDIAALVALYRPGPLDSGMAQQYIKGKHGEAINYPHESLIPILSPTHGVMLYQEELISLVQLMANMTPGEADNFRRIVGRKELDKIDAAVAEFIERSVGNGYSLEVAQTVGDWIKASGRYMFNKSHSVEYGMIAYITAYLKAHYPLEFMCSLLNSEIGDMEKTAEYIQECKRMGIEVLPPDIRYSKSQHSIEGNSIRFGFNAIRGIGSGHITNADNFEEFVFANPNLDKGSLEILVKAGCFPESDRRKLLGKVRWISKYGKRVRQCKEKIAEFSEKGNDKKVAEWQQKLDEIPSIDSAEPIVFDEAECERDVLGLYMRKSPFDRFLTTFKKNTLNYKEWLDTKPQTTCVIGGIVTKYRQIQDKNKNDMAFVEIGSYCGDGSIEGVFFSRAWAKCKQDIAVGNIVRIQGKKDANGKLLCDLTHKLN